MIVEKINIFDELNKDEYYVGEYHLQEHRGYKAILESELYIIAFNQKENECFKISVVDWDKEKAKERAKKLRIKFNSDRELYKNTKGTKCLYCNKEVGDNIEFHHLIPLIFGGDNRESNIIPLCSKCHNRAHGGNKENEISLSTLIKQGIEASGKKGGRKQDKLDKMTEELREDIKEFLTNRSIKQIDLMKKYNISRNTLKKYIKIVKQEIEEGQ